MSSLERIALIGKPAPNCLPIVTKKARQRSASLDDGDRLYLEHHLGVCKLLDSDQSASRITALGKKASSQLRETVAIFHINDKHCHRNNVVERATRFGENCADALETNS